MGIWEAIEEEDEDDEGSFHLSLARDSHKQSDLHTSLQNREQLPSAHTSKT